MLYLTRSYQVYSTDKDSVKINNDNNDDTDGEEEEDNSAQKLTNLRKRWVSNFWLSWDALVLRLLWASNHHLLPLSTFSVAVW